MSVVHGGAFGKIHVAKCGKFRGDITKAGETCLFYKDGIDLVTCSKCIKAHKPGKR